jgi:predicted transcriptional regulator
VDNQNERAVELAAEITMAWLGNPNTRADADDIATFITTLTGTINALDGQVQAASADADQTNVTYMPAVSVRKSLASKDHILSMIDGKPYKTLRRHLATHGLTADQYRERYNLKADYPMVAETYSESRRAMAKKIGLGRKPGDKIAVKAVSKAAPKPSRSKKVEPAEAATA